MKTTVEYLIAAKAAIGVESDSALGKAIGLHRNAVGQYMNGSRVMDDYTALKVAQILGVDPLEVIAAANHERERSIEKREAWANLWNATTQKMGRAASLMVLALGIMIATGSSGVRNEGAAAVPALAQAVDSVRNVPEFSQGGVIAFYVLLLVLFFQNKRRQAMIGSYFLIHVILQNVKNQIFRRMEVGAMP